jgi:hypothetical protein
MRQVVVDMDFDSHAVFFYSLGGRSYSNSFQVEASYMFPFLRGFTLTGAYRFTDTRTDSRFRASAGGYSLIGRKKPLANDFKGLLTASYQSPLKKWQFDVTGQFNGGGRLPKPDAVNPLWDERFGAFQVWNVQATKFFRNWSVYAGSENLFDFMQMNPIVDAGAPRGSDFDGSMIWGPIHGRKLYVGLRYNIGRY